MKKATVFLLASMMSLSLVACGGDDNNMPTQDTVPSQNTTTSENNSMMDDMKDTMEDMGDDMKDTVDDMTTDFNDMVENGKVDDKDGDLTDGENPQSAP